MGRTIALAVVAVLGAQAPFAVSAADVSPSKPLVGPGTLADGLAGTFEGVTLADVAKRTSVQRKGIGKRWLGIWLMPPDRSAVPSQGAYQDE